MTLAISNPTARTSAKNRYWLAGAQQIAAHRQAPERPGLPTRAGSRVTAAAGSSRNSSFAEDEHAIHQLDVLIDFGGEHDDRDALLGQLPSSA